MILFFNTKRYLFFVALITVILTFTAPALAATSQIHIVKYANDGKTILAEKTLTYQEMESTLPVLGDGSAHYYLQGPVFVDDPDPKTEEQLRWNPNEDTNIQEKDMGAVKGTDVKDLCSLVGGMSPGETLKIKASDGLAKEFAYKNVYNPSARQGPLVITWYKDGNYPDSGYDEGMRLLFFADTSVNPWGAHVFGNFDWHESAGPQYWYYYQSGDEKYPTTTGLSVKYVSDILIYSSQSPTSGSGGGGAGSSPPLATLADDSSRYGYRGSKLTTIASGTVNGTLRLFHDPNSTPVVVNNRVREYGLPFDLPPGSNLTLARLYVYVSRSHGIQTNKGVLPTLQTSLNQQQVDAQKTYIDADGDSQRNISATYAYDVLPHMKGNGTYTVSLRNPDYDQSIFTVDDVILLVVYENTGGLVSQYWIDEGCDVILSDPKKGILPRDAATSVQFGGAVNITGNDNAGLFLVSTGIDSLNTTEHAVTFNNQTWYNALSNLTEPAVLRITVVSCLNTSGNTVSIESTIRKMGPDYLVNRNAILVVEHNGNDSIATEPVSATITPASSGIMNATLPFNTTLSQNYPKPCSLSLHSNPEGALIFVNGTYLGKTTPYTLELNPGDSTGIRIELDGYVPVERNLKITNDTLVCEHLYSLVHPTKGLSDAPFLIPEKTSHGGLYVNSRPRPASISLDGIQVPQRTPAVIFGLREGSYTVQLSAEQSDPLLRDRSDIQFEEREVYVYPDAIVPVDITATTSPLREIILDSNHLRGEQFTINGHTIKKTIPEKINSPVFDSFITIFQNQSYVSYPLTVTVNEDHYLVIEPRQHQSLSVFINSRPRGAEVFIDGFRTGFSTPYTFSNISDGPHRIMVTKTGYIPQERIINLIRYSVPLATTSVSFSLDEYPNGFLKVASDPQGASISLDGKDTGEVTPMLFSSVPTGLHSVTISGNNVTTRYPDITVNAVYLINITADLQGR
jgi:hypothetical protein